MASFLLPWSTILNSHSMIQNAKKSLTSYEYQHDSCPPALNLFGDRISQFSVPGSPQLRARCPPSHLTFPHLLQTHPYLCRRLRLSPSTATFFQTSEQTGLNPLVCSLPATTAKNQQHPASSSADWGSVTSLPRIRSQRDNQQPPNNGFNRSCREIRISLGYSSTHP